MALSTSAELKAEIARWVHLEDDPDFVPAIPSFIALCEASLQARLCRSPSLYVRGTAICEAGNPVINVTGMYKVIDASYMGKPLRVVNPASIRNNNGSSGLPTRVGLEGYGALRVDPIPDDAYALSVVYVPVISPSLAGGEPDDSSYNWLLQQNPGLYLFGSLVAAEGYLQNDARMGTWKELYQNAINELVGAKREGDMADSPDVLSIGMFE